MRIQIMVIGMLFCSAGSYAQNMFSISSLHPADTLGNEVRKQAIRYPALRQVSVTTDIFGKGHFNVRSNGKDLISGESQNARISSFLSVPINKWDGNTIGATIYHNEQFFKLSDITSKATNLPVSDHNLSKSTLGLSLNFSRKDALFHTPVAYSAVFTGFSDNLSTVRRFNFSGSISFALKHTADEYLSIGVLVQIDPSAPTPVLPLVNYYKKLNGKGLELIVGFPEGLSLKQALSKNSWLYLGSSVNTYASFYQQNSASLPERFSYNTIEIKSSLGFEHVLGKYVILGVNGGINNVPSARILAKGSNYRDAFIRSTNKATPYGEFRISILPF